MILVHVQVGDSVVYEVEEPPRTRLEAGSQLFIPARKSRHGSLRGQRADIRGLLALKVSSPLLYLKRF